MKPMQGLNMDEKEILLMKFFDGETSEEEERQAEALLKDSIDAQKFFQGLKAVSLETHEWSLTALPVPLPGQLKLWKNILRGIQREGRQHEASERENSWSTWVARIGWGLSGAFATASVGLFMLYPIQKESLSSNLSMASSRVALPVTDVSYANATPQRSFQSSMEVDWMRSDGRLRFIQDPAQRSTIIWVKRGGKNFNRRPSPIQLESSQMMFTPVGK